MYSRLADGVTVVVTGVSQPDRQCVATALAAYVPCAELGVGEVALDLGDRRRLAVRFVRRTPVRFQPAASLLISASMCANARRAHASGAPGPIGPPGLGQE